MAGRGTDIALGGKYDESETWKDNNQIVKEAGGLHVIGTEDMNPEELIISLG